MIALSGVVHYPLLGVLLIYLVLQTISFAFRELDDGKEGELAFHFSNKDLTASVMFLMDSIPATKL